LPPKVKEGNWPARRCGKVIGGASVSLVTASNLAARVPRVVRQPPVGRGRSQVPLQPAERDDVDKSLFTEIVKRVPNRVGRLAYERHDLLVRERAVLLKQLQDRPSTLGA